VLMWIAGKLENPAALVERLAPAAASAVRASAAGRAGEAWRDAGGSATEDDFFCHRLALAPLCLPEIPPAVRASQPGVVDAVAGAAFSRWWERRHENPELAALTRVTDALPALAEVNAAFEGVPLLEWLCQRLQEGDPAVKEAAAEALVRMGS